MYLEQIPNFWQLQEQKIMSFGYFQKYKLNLKFKIPDLSVSFSSGKEDSGTEEASGGSGRRLQHHSGGQAGSSDAAQAG